MFFSAAVDTRCPAFKALADATENGTTQPSQLEIVYSSVGSIGPQGGSANITVETPSKTIWVPQCDQFGSYIELQVRQNGEQFCVVPTSGAVVFDPAQTVSEEEALFGTIYCQCNVWRFTYVAGRKYKLTTPRICKFCERKRENS